MVRLSDRSTDHFASGIHSRLAAQDVRSTSQMRFELLEGEFHLVARSCAPTSRIAVNVSHSPAGDAEMYHLGNSGHSFCLSHAANAMCSAS